MADPIPGLESIRQRGVGAPTDRGVTGQHQGLRYKVPADLGILAIPALAVAGATATGIESPAFTKVIGLTTGFTPGPLGSAAGVTPASALILAPQPFGFLPEVFFQEKPRVPGTNIFLDPFHNIDRQTTRIGDQRRIDARVAQTRGLTELLPDLTEDELLRLSLDRALQQRALGFINPITRQSIIDAAFEERVAARKSQEAVARFAAERRTEALLGGPIGVGLEIQAMLAARSPLIVLVIAAPKTRVGPLDATGRPTAAFVRSLSPLGGPVAMGSLHPAAIHPVNAKALANERVAKGIQRELVHERADP